jgi:hypothetical protein
MPWLYREAAVQYHLKACEDTTILAIDLGKFNSVL